MHHLNSVFFAWTERLPVRRQISEMWFSIVSVQQYVHSKETIVRGVTRTRKLLLFFFFWKINSSANIFLILFFNNFLLRDNLTRYVIFINISSHKFFKKLPEVIVRLLLYVLYKKKKNVSLKYHIRKVTGR